MKGMSGKKEDTSYSIEKGNKPPFEPTRSVVPNEAKDLH